MRPYIIIINYSLLNRVKAFQALSKTFRDRKSNQSFKTQGKLIIFKTSSGCGIG